MRSEISGLHTLELSQPCAAIMLFRTTAVSIVVSIASKLERLPDSRIFYNLT
jgi:hypothetical protein